MKVIREKDPFASITIVIETEKEAKYFWHRLNVSDEILQAYLRLYPSTKEDVDSDFSDKIWAEYDKIFRPEDVYKGESTCQVM